MIPMDSQEFESYLPVYDVIPDQWEDAQAFLTEQLKRIAIAVNTREIGWFIDQELLSGGNFIPGVIAPGNSTPAQFRSILRKVVPCSPLVIGLNTFAHGIVIDANFTLLHMYAAASNSTGLIGEPIPNGSDTLTYDATNIYITVAAAYDRCNTTLEYIQEL
jgi:hypothetical protein